MHFIVIGLTLLVIAAVCIHPSCAQTPPIRPGQGKTVPAAKKPLLKMVYIRTTSPGAAKQLRAMHVDIIRIRPNPQRPPDKKALAGGFIVEAVVPSSILPKLKAKGFDVSEVPLKHESGNRQKGHDR